MAEKKNTTTKKKAVKKTVKKAAAKKPAAKKAAKKGKKIGGTSVRTAAAEARETQEEDSIAPRTADLADPFAKFRGSARRTAARSPIVARLAPGASLPVPPKKQPAPPAAQPPAAPAAPAAKAPPAPAVPPAQPPQAPAAPAAPVVKAPAPAPSAPPAPPAPAAPPSAPAKTSVPPTAKPPAPKATYTLPAEPARPSPSSRPPLPMQKGPKHNKRKFNRQERRERALARPEDMGESASSGDESGLRPLKVSTMVTVRELAEKMDIHTNDLIKKLMSQGVFATINQRIDSETAILVATDYGFELEVVPLHMESEIVGPEKIEERPEDLRPRPPVVTVMGHVDHGKTKLLDAIRKANVVDQESGGITQHIGAYKVKIPKGEVVFLDTPGHEAFTAMRARGTRVTDMVILVVSAADGVMPQTVEAIDHAKEAKVPIIVAVNKIDLPAANPQKVRQDLAGRGLNPEEWGGDTMYVDISAKQNQNIDKLLEAVLLQAEMLELKANPDRPAMGTVVEAELDKKRGVVTTVLIQTGTVSVGDSFVMGLSGGKVKALIDEHGNRLKSAGPATPVELLGVAGGITPQAGDTFNVIKDDRMAREIIEKRNRIHREESLAHKQHVSLLNVKALHQKELAVIIKADVQGSVEVLKDSLEKLSNNEINVRVIHAGLGNVNESDVLLATASNAILLLFHVKTETRAKETAEKNGVEIRSYEIIYELTQDVRAALEGLLEPEVVEVVVGKAEIRAEFKIRGQKVAGSYILEGKAVRGAAVKVSRDGAEVGEGTLETLRHFKDDKKEIEKGMECGISIAGFSGWKVGDLISVVVKEERIRRLEASA